MRYRDRNKERLRKKDRVRKKDQSKETQRDSSKKLQSDLYSTKKKEREVFFLFSEQRKRRKTRHAPPSRERDRACQGLDRLRESREKDAPRKRENKKEREKKEKKGGRRRRSREKRVWRAPRTIVPDQALHNLIGLRVRLEVVEHFELAVFLSSIQNRQTQGRVFTRLLSFNLDKTLPHPTRQTAHELLHPWVDI